VDRHELGLCSSLQEVPG